MGGDNNDDEDDQDDSLRRSQVRNTLTTRAWGDAARPTGPTRPRQHPSFPPRLAEHQPSRRPALAAERVPSEGHQVESGFAGPTSRGANIERTIQLRSIYRASFILGYFHSTFLLHTSIVDFIADVFMYQHTSNCFGFEQNASVEVEASLKSSLRRS